MRSSRQVLCFVLHLFSVESFVLAAPFSLFMSPSNSPTTVTQFARLDDDDAMKQKSVLFEQTSNDDKKQESPSSFAMNIVRNHILQVAVRTGQLCSVAMTWNDDNSDNNDKDDAAVSLLLADLVVDLHTTASALDLNLVVAMQAKLQLNAKKYPVELCKGKAGKYTQYSQVTGVTTTNQSTRDESSSYAAAPLADLVTALPPLATQLDEFATQRQWSQFHTPRNLVLALTGEVGELAELLQWKGDDDNVELSSEQLDKLAQELADVSIYLVRIATVCNLIEPLCEALMDNQQDASTTTTTSE